MKEQEPKPGYLSGKLEGASQPVSQATWDKIEADLNRRKKRRIIFWWFFPAGMLALIVLGSLWFSGKFSPSNPNLTQPKTLSETQNQGQIAKNTPESTSISAVEIPKRSANTHTSPEANISSKTNENTHAQAMNQTPESIESTSFGKVIRKKTLTKSSIPSIVMKKKPDRTNEIQHEKPGEERMTIQQSISPDKSADEAKSETTEKPSPNGAIVVSSESKSRQGADAYFSPLVLKDAMIQSAANNAKKVSMALLEVPELVVVYPDSAKPNKKSNRKVQTLNLVNLQLGAFNQQVSLLGLPALEPAFKPQLELLPSGLKPVRMARLEYSKILPISPTIMAGAGIQASIYRQTIVSTLASSPFTPVSMQATADSLLFQSSPNFKETRYEFTRTGFEAGIHANLFWQPLWSPIGIKVQSTLVGFENNWFDRNSAFLQQYSAGVFYTSPSRWYMNLDWTWFKESNAVLPVKMDSKGKMSGVNFGIGYYWK